MFQPIYVSLPNGQHSMANFSGSVILSRPVSLHNVLYIVNLFNLNMLTNSLPLYNALCFFLHDYVIINTTMRKIGMAKAQNGFYIMNLTLYTHSPTNTEGLRKGGKILNFIRVSKHKFLLFLLQVRGWGTVVDFKHMQTQTIH